MSEEFKTAFRKTRLYPYAVSDVDEATLFEQNEITGEFFHPHVQDCFIVWMEAVAMRRRSEFEAEFRSTDEYSRLKDLCGGSAGVFQISELLDDFVISSVRAAWRFYK